MINSGNEIGLGDNLLNYDDDYYSNEEPAELDANFVGKDYSDEDEFYDYEEYDSIVNGRRRNSENQSKASKSDEFQLKPNPDQVRARLTFRGNHVESG